MLVKLLHYGVGFAHASKAIANIRLGALLNNIFYDLVIGYYELVKRNNGTGWGLVTGRKCLWFRMNENPEEKKEREILFRNHPAKSAIKWLQINQTKYLCINQRRSCCSCAV